MKRTLLVVALAALPLAAVAQTYKWKDERGHVHFTQVPPRSGPYEVLNPATASGSAPNQEALNQSLEQAQKDAPAQQQEAEKLAAQQAQREEKCRKALERVAYMDASTPRRLGVKDEQGNSSRMTQEDFDKQRATWQQQADQNCG